MSETPEGVYRAAAEAALRAHVGDDQVNGLAAEYLAWLIADWWDTPDSRARVDAAYAAGQEAAAQAIRDKAFELGSLPTPSAAARRAAEIARGGR